MHTMSDALWPARGLWSFLNRPAWWGRPMLAMLVTLLLLIAASTAIGWWWWPTAETTGWSWWWQMGRALGLAGVAALVTWMLVLPLLMAVALEALARAVQVRAGAAPTPEPRMSVAVLAGLRVLMGTLHIRLGCLLLALSGAFLGPLGLVIGGLSMAFIACIDAIDIALSVRGLNGAQRLRALRSHRGEVWLGALSAGTLNLVLLPTGIGWLIWLPGLVVGAAEQVLGWDEAKPAELKPVVGTVVEPALSPPSAPPSPALPPNAVPPSR